eukprot:Amastigsp_a844334_5.p5 type:complete len:120 gc:universal Amastigsp_a844334_5:643-1002(+)
MIKTDGDPGRTPHPRHLRSFSSVPRKRRERELQQREGEEVEHHCKQLQRSLTQQPELAAVLRAMQRSQFGVPKQALRKTVTENSPEHTKCDQRDRGQKQRYHGHEHIALHNAQTSTLKT